jgi:signal transduction histidine kinase
VDDRLLELLRATTRADAALLAAGADDPLAFVAGNALEFGAADAVAISLATPDGGRLIVAAVAGLGSEELLGTVHAGAETLDLADGGPLLVVPLPAGGGTRGTLALGRRAGRAAFGSAEAEVATAFAAHAAVCVELADARVGQQRMLLLEDRDCIARDLHDHVIQRLFAAGLTLQGMAVGAEPAAAEKLGRVVEGIDETISQIRTSIFGLRGTFGPRTGALRTRVLAVVAEVARSFPAPPVVRFAGPLDSAVPEELVGEVAAVLRDVLLEAGRHGGSATVAIAVRDGCVEIEIGVAGTRLHRSVPLG